MQLWQPTPVAYVQDIIEGVPGAVEALAAFMVVFRGLVRGRPISVRRAAVMTGTSKSRAHRAQQEAKAFFAEWQEGGRTNSGQPVDARRARARRGPDTEIKEEPGPSASLRTLDGQQTDTSETPAGRSQGGVDLQEQEQDIHSEPARKRPEHSARDVLESWRQVWELERGSAYYPGRGDLKAAASLLTLAGSALSPEVLRAAIGAYLRGYRWPKSGPPTLASFVSVAGRWLNTSPVSCVPELSEHEAPAPDHEELPRRVVLSTPAPVATEADLLRWPEHCKSLRRLLSPQDFLIWIQPLTPTLQDGSLTLLAPNAEFLVWVAEHYLEQLQHAVGVSLALQVIPRDLRRAK